VEELSPDIVLPISTGERRDVGVAFGVSPDEVLWLTAPESAAESSVFTREMASSSGPTGI
jgi:hypothetical protein